MRSLRALFGVILALTIAVPTTLAVAEPAQAVPADTNYTRITNTNWDTFKTGKAPYFSISVKASACRDCPGIPGKAQLKLDGVHQRWHTLDKGSTTYHVGRSDLRDNRWVEVAVRTWPAEDGRPSQVVKFDVIDRKPTRADKIMDVARAQLGKPYKFGAAGPGSFDCSGLVVYAYLKGIGKRLPHYTGSLRHVGRVVSRPERGDIVWTPGHVALYAGSGVVIEALRPGTRVRRVSMWQRNPVYIRP